ncbi:MAG TPA: hypothetical protein VKY85_26115 [Candidatus Angelobacter sp.]|nr:hypothetical protein [Candidatus Angelobacter sp.]
MTFPSQLDARQFLINKITDQASRTATSLSDVERRMLQLNLDEPESATGIPVEVLEDTSRTYEKKITGLLQSAYNRDRDFPQEQRKYKDALRSLRNSDHYILIIATAAIPQGKRLGNFAVYILIALAMAVMIVVLQIWTRGK